MIKYCRRCDLGFCEEHEQQHTSDPTHDLVEDERVDFCAVCSGIYAPMREDEQ